MKAFTCILLTLSSLSLLSPVPALADWDDGPGIVATYWQGTPGEPGRWFDARNWTRGVPTEGTTAYISNGGTAVVYEHSAGMGAAARELLLGGKSTGTVDHISGSMKVMGGLWLGQGGWGSGTYNLSEGSFSAGYAFIGSGAARYDWTTPMPWQDGRFRQIGGSSHIRGALYVGHRPYAVNTWGGTEPALLDEAGLLGEPDEAYRYRLGALYELAGGDLTASQTYVGYGGKGKFLHSDGTNEVTYGLYVGGGTNWIQTDTGDDPATDPLRIYPWYYAEGTYVLTGGRLSARSVHVGQHGRGRFVQSGGSSAVKGTLQVGGNWWWWRPLDANNTYDAEADGMTSIFAPDYYYPADGSYDLSRGELATSATEVGIGGYGRFAQSGGAHQTGALRIGGYPYWPIVAPTDPTRTEPTGMDGEDAIWPIPYPAPGRGSYTLTGGKLYTNRLEIAAGYSPWPWKYAITDGAVPDSDDSITGRWHDNYFKQTDGVCVVRGALHVGYQPKLTLATGLPESNPDGSYGVVDGVSVAQWYRPGALYELAGGELSASWAYIGYGGAGRFVQSGGQSQIDYGLYVGGGLNYVICTADGTRPAVEEMPYHPWYYAAGSYTLSGGCLTAQTVHVGRVGRGTFVQSGGDSLIKGTLQVGSEPLRWILGADGTYTPASAEGELGSIVPSLCRIPGEGTYHLMKGELTTGATEIGVGGYGRFVQSGGAHLTNVLRIGGRWYWPLIMAPDGSDEDPTGTNAAGDPAVTLWPYPPIPTSSGTYTLSDGKLVAEHVTLGYYKGYRDILADPADPTTPDGGFAPWPVATFTQTGGDVAVKGGLDVADSSYNLLGGTLAAGSVNLMGWYNIGHSQFRQSGGICRIAGALNVGADIYKLDGDPNSTGGPSDPYYFGWETFVLSGGELSAEHVRIGGRGRALLMQTGGEMTVAGRLDIAGANATYDVRQGALRAGTVRVGPGFVSSTNAAGGLLHLGGWAAKITVTDRLVFDAGGRFTAEGGSRIAMTGADLANYSTTPTALGGLDSLRLVFSIGPEDDAEWETYEVAGKDLGFVRHGWYENFQLHTLQLGGEDVAELKLIDEFDNQPDFDGPEALYVRYLVIGPGSRIDLNGLNLYYLRGKIHDDAQIIHGDAERAIEADWSLPGDADLNGIVDADDLSVLLANWDLPSDWTTGDFDGSGVASDNDLSVLLSNWSDSPSAPRSVPEPTTLALLAFGGLAAMRRRRR